MHYYGDINDYISHHGILGQRWGKKNGPPYPLGSGDHSASEKKAGWRKSLSGNNAVRYRGKNKENLENVGSASLKLKKTDDGPESDVKAVNPEYTFMKSLFDFGLTHNCVNCTTAYELRRRGYDVSAQKNSKGYPAEIIHDFFPKAEIKSLTNFSTFKGRASSYALSQVGLNKELTKKTLNTLAKQGDGARGTLFLKIEGFGVETGHAMSYSVENGSVVLRDPQLGRTYKDKDIPLILNWTYDAGYARLDNVDFDGDKIKEVVR